MELSTNFLPINRVPFLTTLSKHIHYATVGALDNMQIVTLEKTIQTVLLWVYKVCDFNVVMIHVDIQLKAMKDWNVLGTKANVASKE